ncbi:MAG: PE/PPE C-terminal domain-containing protein [Gemmatimonadales bacterium]
MSAGLGRAASIGALSVPQTWAAGAPAMNPVTTGFPGAGFGSALGVEAGGPAGVPPPLTPITNMAGNGVSGAAPRYGFRPTVIGHSPVAG